MNNIAGGNYNGDEFTTTSLDIVFGQPMTAFGADFIGAATTSGLFFTINGETVQLAASLPNPGTGFFGVVSSTPFTLIDVTGGASPNEIYDMDNFERIAIPEPAGLAGVALACALITRRLRRRRGG